MNPLRPFGATEWPSRAGPTIAVAYLAAFYPLTHAMENSAAIVVVVPVLLWS